MTKSRKLSHTYLLLFLILIASVVPACTQPDPTATTDKPQVNVSAWEAYPVIAQASEQTLTILITDVQNKPIAGMPCIASILGPNNAPISLDFPATQADGRTSTSFMISPADYPLGNYVGTITCALPSGTQTTQLSFSVE